MKKTLIDAGALLAFINHDDHHHEWAQEVFKSLRPPVYITEPAVTEAVYLVKDRSGHELAMELLRLLKAHFKLVCPLAENWDFIIPKMEKYSQMDLADATLVRATELLQDCELVTVDRKDFSTFRRFNRDVIPIIAPPKK
jgi:predicted nucleic acid-binding protein